MNTIFFAKMHGIGNDFMVIDNFRQSLPVLSPKIIQKLADRRFGVGFDQLLIIEKSTYKDIDFNYRIFNKDGNEVAQCGNGARCLAHYVKLNKLSNKKELSIVTLSQKLLVRVNDDYSASVEFPAPLFAPAKIPFLVDKKMVSYDILGENVGALSMGNPHCVLIKEDIETIKIIDIAQKIQKSHYFSEGVNVGFMQIIDRKNILLRVYERGAGETLACGSGACAAVIYGIILGKLDTKVNVKLKGGGLVIIWQNNTQDKKVIMSGGASYVYSGSIAI